MLRSRPVPINLTLNSTGVRFGLGNDCLAVVPLPSYEISGLWTGQISNEDAWKVSLIRTSKGGWRILE